MISQDEEKNFRFAPEFRPIIRGELVVSRISRVQLASIGIFVGRIDTAAGLKSFTLGRCRLVIFFTACERLISNEQALSQTRNHRPNHRKFRPDSRNCRNVLPC